MQNKSLLFHWQVCSLHRQVAFLLHSISIPSGRISSLGLEILPKYIDEEGIRICEVGQDLHFDPDLGSVDGSVKLTWCITHAISV